MRTFILFVIITTVLHFSTTVLAQNWECTMEQYEYAPEKVDRFCVFRSVEWKKGKPEPEFPASTATNVAFLDSNFAKIPDRVYDHFPQLEILVIRNSTLEELIIKNRMKIVYAESNKIKSLRVERSDSMLKELHMRGNPLTNIDTIVRSLRALEVLDLSETSAINDDTIDLSVFATLPNLTELHVRRMQAYYVENERQATLPKLKLIDLSGNLITPSNFRFKVFRTLPALEDLYLRDTSMTNLIVSDIREDLPSLKRFYIDGNDFRCDLLEALLEHLKEKGIETEAESRDCILGFESIEGLCCLSYIKPMPPAKPKNDTGPTGTDDPAPPKDTGTITTDPTRTNEHVTDKTVTTNEILLYVGIAIAVLVGVAIVAFFVFKLRQKHQPVPTHDNRMPEEL
uniref:Uncharacterized protein n=1 Tax=Anopheles minimus TaxID=112268 RepID=A0A1Y9IW54_9DIPT